MRKFRILMCGLFMWMIVCAGYSFSEDVESAASNEGDGGSGENVAITLPDVTPPDADDSAPGIVIGDEEMPEPEEVFPTDEQVFAYFSAVLRGDFAEAGDWLERGMDVDTALPPQPSREFLERITESRMVYYATREQGVTALMMAAGLGNVAAVDFLLEHGADRLKKTRRNRTHPLWLASRTGDVELMRKLMNLDPQGEWKALTAKVNLTEQRMSLLRDGEVILESPVSSGKPSKPTPTGKFVVTDKHRDWKSSIYNVSMPHFVRLSCSAVGFHAGRLPGYPASGGCIRLPADKARDFFAMVPIGTLVVIED